MIIQPAASPYRPDVKIKDLGPKIGDAATPAKFPKTIIRFRNDRWAQTVGLDNFSEEDWLSHFGRLCPLPDNLDPPLALRYHGHQFRVYNPEIGDGRGFLYAQMRDHKNRLMDLGTKGSGTTPWSRNGDGKLTLKGGVREILATEMLEALGVETSKTFSLIETGEELIRGDEPSPTRSAVMVRLNHSHIRFGTFQRIAFEQDAERMSALVAYVMKHYYDDEQSDEPAAALLHRVVEKIAVQAASYMVAGFVHGVLNTDNINITGESFDYGPWRFTPKWDPTFTAAYFDQNSLYSFARQPEALHWNLGQLAVALRTICEAEPLIEALERFPALYQEAITRQFCWRLGVTPKGTNEDRSLIEACEKALVQSQVDIDRFFFDFAGGGQPIGSEYENEEFSGLRDLLSGYNVKRARRHEYWKRDAPCSMHIEEVESIWDAIADRDDWSHLHRKIESIRNMGEALRS